MEEKQVAAYDLGDVFLGMGVPIKLKDPQDFLKIKETLTRIGVASKLEKRLCQSCHILHKKNKVDQTPLYAIMHFKEMLKLDGKPTNFDEIDLGRRNKIANLLADWGLCEIINREKYIHPQIPISMVKVIPHKEKEQWVLEAKYRIGSAKNYNK